MFFSIVAPSNKQTGVIKNSARITKKNSRPFLKTCLHLLFSFQDTFIAALDQKMQRKVHCGNKSNSEYTKVNDKMINKIFATLFFTCNGFTW